VVRTVALFYLNALDHAWRLYGVSPLQIITEDKRIDIGGDEPHANVLMSWWEITRVVSGRRSSEQVRALEWNVNPAPWMDDLFVFGPRDTPLEE
jgi:hypothetical protein